MKRKGLKVILVSLLFLIFAAGSVLAVYRMGIFDLIKNRSTAENDVLGEAYHKPLDVNTLALTETWGLVPLNQVIVMLSEENEDLLKKILNLSEGELVGEIEYLNLYQIEIPLTEEAAFNDLMVKLQAIEGVESAFPNSLGNRKINDAAPCTVLKDPDFWNDESKRPYEMIGMEDAWKIIHISGVKLQQTKVGVLDDALYSGSRELSGNIKFAGDVTDAKFRDKDGELDLSGHGHGTLVTHVIAADKNNGGVAGVASVLEDKLTVEVDNLYEDLDILELDDIGDELYEYYNHETGMTDTLNDLIKLHNQVKNGAKVINCSFGATEPDENNKWICEAYWKFFEKMIKDFPEVVFVVAAGNEGSRDWSKGGLTYKNYYPGGISLSNVITVGALNNDGSRALFSNYSTGSAEVTLSAPGVDIAMGTDINGDPIIADGTSFSTPMVTGTVALLQSIDPKLTAEQIKVYLMANAASETDNGDNPSVPIPSGMGQGLLRVDRTVLALINDLREKKGLERIDMNDLDDLSSVNLKVEYDGEGLSNGSTGSYLVTA